MLVMNVALSAFSMDDDTKLLLDLGLSTLLISGLLLAAFCASGSISGEIEDRTVLTIVSKPISRATFLLGKFLGLNAALLMAYYLSSVIFIFTVRHRVLQSTSQSLDGPVLLFSILAIAAALLVAGVGNYLYRWHFSSTLLRLSVPLLTVALVLVGFVGRHWEFQSFAADFATKSGAGQLPVLLIALGLIYMGILMISGVALAASTRLGQIMTLILCTAFFLLGLVSNYLFGRFADDHLLANILYQATGNLQPFWITDALTQGHEVTLAYAGTAMIYGLLYTAGLLSLAIALFQTREVG
jgi:ABC-type transport system involved in multi-copper enzyme maturation permease subunit